MRTLGALFTTPVYAAHTGPGAWRPSPGPEPGMLHSTRWLGALHTLTLGGVSSRGGDTPSPRRTTPSIAATLPWDEP